MRILLTALAIALMMANASAQGVGGMGGTGGGGGRHQQRDKTDKTEKPKVDDKAYNAALKTIPDKHFDAWGGMR
jgi:hypothetical protein